MTALSTDAIRARINDIDSSKRLIVRPMLDEPGQLKEGQSSIDIRLGLNFCLIAPSLFGSISEFGEIVGPILPLSKLYRREYIPLGSSIVIHPHQFMLAQTLEYIRLPKDLMAYVVGRSTWGRLGLIVATAIGVHPGFASGA